MEHEKDILLNSFLERWSLKSVENMTLPEYTNLHNHDTFCYWIEYKTQKLANISGSANSFKFEIFDRIDKNKIYKSTDFVRDNIYSWRKRAGYSREEAFENTKRFIITIIKASLAGEFEKIDSREIKLTPIFKWKIAFLYSQKKITAISDKKILKWLAEQYGMLDVSKVRVSSVHRYLIDQIDKNSYWESMSEMWELCDYFKRNGQEIVIASRLRGRRETEQKKLNVSFRIIDIHKKLIITHEHNKIQSALYGRLVLKFMKKAVKMEKNYIDIRVEIEDRVIFFEVKCANSAILCIRMALGQVIEYAFKDKTNKKKEIIIYGNQEPNDSEKKYIDKLANLLPDLSFSYFHKLDQIDTFN